VSEISIAFLKNLYKENISKKSINMINTDIQNIDHVSNWDKNIKSNIDFLSKTILNNQLKFYHSDNMFYQIYLKNSTE
jgi:hypothetical protein